MRIRLQSSSVNSRNADEQQYHMKAASVTHIKSIVQYILLTLGLESDDAVGIRQPTVVCSPSVLHSAIRTGNLASIVASLSKPKIEESCDALQGLECCQPGSETSYDNTSRLRLWKPFLAVSGYLPAPCNILLSQSGQLRLTSKLDYVLTLICIVQITTEGKAMLDT